MATDKIMVDDEEIAGVELSKEEKKRLKRQEKKLKKLLRRYTKGKYEIYKDRRSSGIQKQVGTRGYTLEKQCAQKGFQRFLSQ